MTEGQRSNRRLVQGERDQQVFVPVANRGDSNTSEYHVLLSNLRKSSDVLLNLNSLHKILPKLEENSLIELQGVLESLSALDDEDIQDGLTAVVSAILMRQLEVTLLLCDFIILRTEKSKNLQVQRIAWNALSKAHPRQKVSDKALKILLKAGKTKKLSTTQHETIVHLIYLTRDETRSKGTCKNILETLFEITKLELDNKSLCNKISKIFIALLPFAPKKSLISYAKSILEWIVMQDKKWAITLFKSTADNCSQLFIRIISLLAEEIAPDQLDPEIIEGLAIVLLQSRWEDSIRNNVFTILKAHQNTLNLQIKALFEIECLSREDLQRKKTPAVFKWVEDLLQIVRNGGKLTFGACKLLESILLNPTNVQDLKTAVIEVFGAATNNQSLESSAICQICSLYEKGKIKLSQTFLKIIENAELQPKSLLEKASLFPEKEEDKLLSLDLLYLLSVRHNYHFESRILKRIIDCLMKENSPSFLRRALPKIVTILENNVERDCSLPLYTSSRLQGTANVSELYEEFASRIAKLLTALREQQDDFRLNFSEEELCVLQRKIETSGKDQAHQWSINIASSNLSIREADCSSMMIEEEKDQGFEEDLSEIATLLIQEYFPQEVQKDLEEVLDLPDLLFQVLESSLKPTKLLNNFKTNFPEDSIMEARCLCLLLECITLNRLKPWKTKSFASDLYKFIPGCKTFQNEIESLEFEPQIEFIKLMLLVLEINDSDKIIRLILKKVCSKMECTKWCNEIIYILLRNLISWEQQTDFALFASAVTELDTQNGYQEDDLRRDRLLILLVRRLLWDERQCSTLDLREILIFLQVGAEDAEVGLLMSQGENWVENLRQNWIYSHLSPTWSDDEKDKFCKILGLERLAWSASCCQEFFNIIQEAESAETFDLLHLVEQHRVSEPKVESLIYSLTTSKNQKTGSQLLKEMKQKLSILILEEDAHNKDTPINFLGQVIADCQWSLENSLFLLNTMKAKMLSMEKNQIDRLISRILQVLVEYKISWVIEIKEIMINNPLEKWEDEFFKKVAFETNPLEKSLQMLLDELKRTNSIAISTSDLQSLKDDFNGIIQQSEREMDPIRNWEKTRVQKWRSQEFNTNTTQISEILAVIRRASFLQCGRQLRATQLLAILIFWRSDKSKKGRLAQIITGEGKSLTIAALAVLYSLYGTKIDIITSSYQLAQRDQAEWSPFYELFGLKASHNCDTRNSEGAIQDTDSYRSDIVYGDAGAFQCDYLNQVYYGRETRGSRPFEVAIVDEVDSMLLDEGSKSALLSSPCPGFSFLQPLLVAIWHQLHQIDSHFFNDDENKGTLLWSLSKAGKPSSSEKEEVYEVHDRDEFLKDRLKAYTQFLVENAGSEVYVPKHLKEFASKQIKTWADSAVMALRMKEHRDYVITTKDGKKEVAPVDFKLTGVVQVGLVWQNGLHQFIQMKHNIELSSESLSSCFVSNISFFRKYTRLFGLTGTLGPPDSQKLLADTYSIDIFIMPTYKPRQFIELPLKLTENKEAWQKAITVATAEEIRRNRSLLILCQTIEDASEISKLLLPIAGSEKCTTYERDDVDDNKIETLQMGCGQVLIATNLAGRGVDLKVANSVEENGGLHVILTFLPSNLRVEQQAFGRTARQGKKGSGQIILDSQRTFEEFPQCVSEDQESRPFSTVKEIRDWVESVRLLQVRNVELPQTLIKDKLFERFVGLICPLKGNQRGPKNFFVDAVEERWAIFLKCFEEELAEKLEKEESLQSLEAAAETQYDSFHKEIENSFHSQKHVKNPIYFILSGMQQLVRENYLLAIGHFDSALSYGDSVYAFGAYYNRAYARIKKQVSNYKELACSDLKETKTQIENSIIPGLESMLVLLAMSSKPEESKEGAQNTDGGSNQIQLKVNLLRQCVDYIDKAIDIIKKCKKENYIQVSTCTYLAEMKKDIKISDSNLSEIRLIGLQMFFEVEEKVPVCWWGIIGLALLAAAQIVAGSLLTVFGAPNLGMALIGEGLSDAFKATMAAINGESIDWKAYAVEKAVSLAISVATMGWGAVKEGLSLVKHGAQKLFTRVGQTLLKEGISTSTKEGLKLAAKLVLKEAAIFCGKKLLDKGLDLLAREAVNKLVQEFKDLLSSSLKERLKGEFKEQVKMILALFSLPQSTEGRVRIVGVVDNIMSEKASSLLSTACSMLVDGIGRAVVGNAIVTLITIGMGIKNAATLSNKFVNQLEQDIKTCKTTAWNDKLEYWKTTLQRIISNPEETNKLVSNIKYGEKLTKQTIEACVSDKKLHNQIYDVVENQINQVFEFSDNEQLKKLEDYIIECFISKFSSIVQGQIVSPCSQALSGKIAACVKEHYSSLDKKIEQYASARTIKRVANKMANKKAQKNPSKKAPTSAMDIEHSPEVKALIDSTSQNGEGGLEHLGALSDHTGRKIDVYINGKRHTTIGDNLPGEPIRLNYEPPTGENSGHWLALDANLKQVHPSGTNNCLYDAVGAVANIPGQQLRNAAALHIQQNANTYQKICTLTERLSGTNYMLHGAGRNIRMRDGEPVRGHNAPLRRPPSKPEINQLREQLDQLRSNDIFNNGGTRTIIPRDPNRGEKNGARIDQQPDNKDWVNIAFQVGKESLAKARIATKFTEKPTQPSKLLNMVKKALMRSVSTGRESLIYRAEKDKFPKKTTNGKKKK